VSFHESGLARACIRPTTMPWRHSRTAPGPVTIWPARSSAGCAEGWAGNTGEVCDESWRGEQGAKVAHERARGEGRARTRCLQPAGPLPTSAAARGEISHRSATHALAHRHAHNRGQCRPAFSGRGGGGLERDRRLQGETRQRATCNRVSPRAGRSESAARSGARYRRPPANQRRW
jgi:hypothetical protein